MVRPTPLRSLPAAVLPLLSLLACGSSPDDGKPATVSSPAPATAPASGAASPLTVRTALPEPRIKVESSGPVPQASDASRAVATVNGQPIPVERVYSMYQTNKSMLEQRGRALSATDDQSLKADIFELVLADELLYQAAVAAGINASPADVDGAVNQFKKRVGSEEAYAKFLAGAGLTDAEVRQEIERNLETEAYRKSVVAGRTVSEEQAKKYYDANRPKGMFNVPERVHVQYILLKVTAKDPESVRADARKRAEEAAKRAAAGEDFSALANQYSQDATASRGGDIGLVPRGVMFPQFEQVAFSVKPGTVSTVFETPNGFNVLKVLERKPESTQSFEDVKKELMSEMGLVLEQQMVEARIRELAARAQIAVLDRSFVRPPAPPAMAPPTLAAKP